MDVDRYRPALALQLYTMRSVGLPLDPLLARVAACGYDGVETVALQGVRPEVLRDAALRHGLRLASAHVALRTLREAPERSFDDYAVAGIPLLVVPWLEGADRPTTRAGWAALGRELAALGAVATARGLALAYHHHDFELVDLGGATALEALLEVAAPDHLAVELDVGWFQVAGHDAVAWLERLGPRCARLHAKDVAATPASHPWADVGSGVVPWPRLLSAAARAGVPWLVVEHDAPSDPWRTAQRSLSALRTLLA
jgi:sugar phosphate isomerase/epimerase